MINDYLVSSNVQMGANAYISWNQVSNQPFIPRNASDVGALPTNSSRLTYIDSNGAYFGNLSADQITAGTISANRLNGGTISGVNIDVSTNVTVGNKITLGDAFSNGEKSIVFNGQVGLYATSGLLEIESGNGGIQMNSYTSFFDTVDFSNARQIIGLNATAKFG